MSVFLLSKPAIALIIIHDRVKFENSGNRLTTDAVSAVYLSRWDSTNDHRKSVNALIYIDEAARDQAAGVYRLSGIIEVERWESYSDFRVKLAMHSMGPEEASVEGTLIKYETQEFRPLESFVMILWSLGLGGMAQVNSPK